MKPLLEALDISFHYPDKDEMVVRDLSLTIELGQLIRLGGRNGTGKTTALKVLSESLIPTSGGIKKPDSTRCIYLDQNSSKMLAPDLTVSEHFQAFLMPKAIEQIRIVLEEFDLNLQRIQSQFAGQLSGGQAQIFTLVIALYGGYNLLMLDEFTAHLDPLSETIAYALLNKAIDDKKVGVILVSHRDPQIRIDRHILC